MDANATAEALRQIDALMSEYEALPWTSGMRVNTRGEAQRWRRDDALGVRILSAVMRLTPLGLGYTNHLRAPNHLDHNVKVMEALRADIAAGSLSSASELARADLFADLLEGAEYLQSEGWKDAAAVMIGGVLEAHLRKLRSKNASETEQAAVKSGTGPERADTMIAELYRAGLIGKLEHKEVTAWLGLRNHAAHGEYGLYDGKQVRLMLDGVKAFIARHPA